MAAGVVGGGGDAMKTNVHDQMIGMKLTDYAEIIHLLDDNLKIMYALEIAHMNGRVEVARNLDSIAGREHSDATHTRDRILHMAKGGGCNDNS